MANAEQLKALIRSHADGDQERFYSIALQIAASAARSGHARFADELRAMVKRAQDTVHRPESIEAPSILLAQPRGELSGLLTFSYPETRLGDMVLDSALRARLDRVVVEQRHRVRIEEHGLRPLRKLLLSGPPGTGKTMTAAALAGELKLPLFTIQLHALITRYLGETAAKLRLVFDAMNQTRGVYLFDEFDALGGDRGIGNDVGEIRRVLNSFLVFLEQDASESLVIAATNHVAMLDRALFRRFDLVVEYPLPSAEIAIEILRNRLAFLDTENVAWTKIAHHAAGLSHADITHACQQAAKDAVLEGHKVVDSEMLMSALRDRAPKKS
jgi:SpoVK/Ycf46/Vps4 family AAA+-type ATPase